MPCQKCYKWSESNVILRYPHDHPIPKRPPKPLDGEGRKVYTVTLAGYERVKTLFAGMDWRGMVKETRLDDGRIRIEVTP